jgi:uncharacterized protein (DUF1778 family)
VKPQENNRTARIEARIAPDALAVVRRAAEIQGRSVSDFVVTAAQEAAQKAVAETESSACLAKHRKNLFPCF